jgi:hypothetical protein
MTKFIQIMAGCKYRHQLPVERRPGNALNVEIGAPLPRCTQKPPDGRGVTRDGGTLDYWRNGGSMLAYGLCEADSCPEL